jgi:hypothetical protein
VPFSADRRSFVDGFEQVDAAKRQRLSTVFFLLRDAGS